MSNKHQCDLCHEFFSDEKKFNSHINRITGCIGYHRIKQLLSDAKKQYVQTIEKTKILQKLEKLQKNLQSLTTEYLLIKNNIKNKQTNENNTQITIENDVNDVPVKTVNLVKKEKKRKIHDDCLALNNRIENEICYETIKQLQDINLIEEYKSSKSVKNEIEKLRSILLKYTDKSKEILNEYIMELIPPGLKGAIRGNRFNNIIKEKILSFELNDDYEVSFEKKCEKKMTNEIPDWYIMHKPTNKVLIGMNQLDLWSGGQQINRGFNYLKNNNLNTTSSKLLCVVCNHVSIFNKTNKTYELFKIGFSNNTLCYINNLQNIVYSFFNISL